MSETSLAGTSLVTEATTAGWLRAGVQPEGTKAACRCLWSAMTSATERRAGRSSGGSGGCRSGKAPKPRRDGGVGRRARRSWPDQVRRKAACQPSGVNVSGKETEAHVSKSGGIGKNGDEDEGEGEGARIGNGSSSTADE